MVDVGDDGYISDLFGHILKKIKQPVFQVGIRALYHV